MTAPSSIEIAILSLLEQQPHHGYDIWRLIQLRSERVRTSSLYVVLRRLEQQGWIEGRWVERPALSRRRYYSLTAEGRGRVEWRSLHPRPDRLRQAWRVPGSCVLALAIMPTPPPNRALNREWPRVYIADPFVHEAARRTLDTVVQHLSFQGCQDVLSDFVDARGQSLTAVLAQMHLSAEEYLERLIFVDGARHARCGGDGILAFTSPGSRVVYLCGRDFFRMWQREPEQTRVAIIHEMLHSLGLGENPPDSRQISRRVKRRCWQAPPARPSRRPSPIAGLAGVPRRRRADRSRGAPARSAPARWSQRPE